jgi:DNA polymerase-3 subunit gamma/tau
VTEPLALKYRPRKFEDMIGQRIHSVVLQRLVETASVPTGLLFSGPSGVGKTTAARILASELNEGEIEDTIEIDAASNGGVADIRSLIETLRYGHQGHYRVVIIDEVHSVTREGFNALLKTLEEPPAGTVFVLVTTEPEKVPETILSRVMEFPFTRIQPGEIHARLAYIAAQEKLNISPELLVDLSYRSAGSARVGTTLLQQADLAQVTTPAEYAEMIGDYDTAADILAALLTGNSEHIFTVLDQQLRRVGNPLTISTQLSRVLKELLILRSGGSVKYWGSALDSRKELASRLETERIFAAARILWDLKTKVRVSNDARENLELALILVSEIFSRGKTESVPTPAPSALTPAVEPTAPKKLSLADLRRR